MLTNETDATESIGISLPNWGAVPPRGGMAVMNRILKDKATVPLVNRLRTWTSPRFGFKSLRFRKIP